MSSYSRRIKRNLIEKKYGVRTSISNLKKAKRKREEEQKKIDDRRKEMEELVEMEKRIEKGGSEV